MLTFFRKAALSVALVASALVATAAPAEARDRFRNRGGNDAAIAVGVGLVGLAVGAAIASDNRRDRFYDRRFYNRGFNDRRFYNRGFDRGFRGPRYYGGPVYRGYNRYDRYRDIRRADRRFHRRYGY